MRRAAVAALAALLLILTACAGLPTSGQVYPGRDPLDVDVDPGVAYVPDAPQPGASPDQIVDGFLRAGSGPQDRWATARQFLTAAFAEEWEPSASVTIDRLPDRATAVSSEGQDTASVTATVSASGVVDETGAYTPQQATASDLPFELALVDGEWRISAAPDGIVLFEEQFRTVFRSASLAFFDPTWTYLVPDIRWVLRTNAATYAASRLVNGTPAGWLTDAVRSAFPTDLALGGAVPVTDGVAQVELGDAALSLDSETLGRMQAQLNATLRSVDVASVQMTVDGTPVQVSAAPVRSTRVDTRALVVDAAGVFGFLDTDSVEPVGELSEAIASIGGVSAIEAGADLETAAVLSASGAVVRAADDGTTSVLDTRDGLIAPSIDPLGTVWSVPGGQPNALQAATRDGEVLTVGGAWPDASSVRSMQVSRDGARVAAIVTVRGRVELWAAGIRRSADALALGETVVLASGLGEGLDVAWLDDTTVGLLERVGDEMRLREQPVGGPGTDLTVPAGIAAVVGGNSTARLLADTGAVYTRQTTSWQQIATGVTVLATQQGSP